MCLVKLLDEVGELVFEELLVGGEDEFVLEGLLLHLLGVQALHHLPHLAPTAAPLYRSRSLLLEHILQHLLLIKVHILWELTGTLLS